MADPLHVLIVEDSPPDAELLLRELRRGYDPRHQRVDSADDLHRAIGEQAWDLILCDYTMAGFTGTEALSIVRRQGLDVPLIFVSGTIGEETAVAAMRAGAQDYVVKDNLKRLLPAIERELRDAALRREARTADARRVAAESRFRDLLAMAPDAIVAIDRDHGITIFNHAAEALFGYAAAEVMGQPIELLLPAASGNFPGAGGDAAVSADAGAPRRTPQAGAMAGRRRDGGSFPVEASFGSSIDNGRETVLAVIRDVTRRRELEAQLHQSQKMEVVGQLTGGLAHDFNNLLTVIIGNLEALQDEVPGGSRPLRMIELALCASLRGAALTRQMLAFSRRQALEARAFELNGLVANAIGLFRRTLGAAIVVETRLAEDLWTAFADPAQVETALMNLALNARDAMPDGGRLTIETANRRLDEAYVAATPDAAIGDHLLLSVTDTGTGIAPEALERVFEPFFTTKNAGQGTGLGLSMVYGFVRQSGGHVTISSTAAQGTTVRLFFPRAEGPAAAAELVAATEPEPAVGNAVILVVEDDEDVRATAVAMMAALGCEIREAADAQAALVLLQDGLQVDLLFTDLSMPGGMSGLELADQVRRIRPGVKVLIATGHVDTAQARIAEDGRTLRLADGDGQYPVLHKPYRRVELLQKLRETLEDAGGAAGMPGA